MLTAGPFTIGGAIRMKDVNQTLQLPAVPDQALSTSSSSSAGSGAACVSTAPPMTASDGTAEQQSSTTAVPRNGREARDSSWLELEACREHMRQACPRPADECRYAHPDPGIYVKEGKVTCCYDYLKNRCYRERCRYFHPPEHIKDRLVNAGRQFGAMMSNLHMNPGGVSNLPFNSPSPGPSNNMFSHVNPAPVPLMGPVIYSPDGRIMSAAPPGLIPGPVYGSGNERIDICPYFAQGNCQNHMCPMLHPEPHVRLNLDSTVTVCRDFVRGGCSRETCRYFHPPGNIVNQLDSGATPALLQQGIMVASPVMPVYPPLMYPGVVTPLPTPAGSGMPLYPLVLSPPPPVSMMQHYSNTPISTITSVMQETLPTTVDDGSPPQSIIMTSEN